jgi:hypothetical protein
VKYFPTSVGHVRIVHRPPYESQHGIEVGRQFAIEWEEEGPTGSVVWIRSDLGELIKLEPYEYQPV